MADARSQLKVSLDGLAQSFFLHLLSLSDDPLELRSCMWQTLNTFPIEKYAKAYIQAFFSEVSRESSLKAVLQAWVLWAVWGCQVRSRLGRELFREYRTPIESEERLLNQE